MHTYIYTYICMYVCMYMLKDSPDDEPELGRYLEQYDHDFFCLSRHY